LRSDEVFLTDEAGMGERARDDPLLRGCPPDNLALTAAGVSSFAVGSLPVPHLTADVAWIGDNRRDGPQRPAIARPVTIALLIPATATARQHR